MALRDSLGRRHPGLLGMMAATATIVCVATNANLPFLMTPREELPQFAFARVMESKEEPTLLNYGFLDGGFYTAAGLLPATRYFTGLNIANDEIMREQTRIAENGEVDFLVSQNVPLDFERYVLVAVSGDYRLYALDSLGLPRIYE